MQTYIKKLNFALPALLESSSPSFLVMQCCPRPILVAKFVRCRVAAQNVLNGDYVSTRQAFGQILPISLPRRRINRPSTVFWLSMRQKRNGTKKAPAGARRRACLYRTALRSVATKPLPRGKGLGDGVTWTDGVPSPARKSRPSKRPARAGNGTIIEPFLRTW